MFHKLRNTLEYQVAQKLCNKKWKLIKINVKKCRRLYDRNLFDRNLFDRNFFNPYYWYDYQICAEYKNFSINGSNCYDLKFKNKPVKSKYVCNKVWSMLINQYKNTIIQEAKDLNKNQLRLMLDDLNEDLL